MTITKAEVLQAKRAVVVLSELAKVAIAVSGQPEPLEIKQDRLALIKLIRKLKTVVVEA